MERTSEGVREREGSEERKDSAPASSPWLAGSGGQTDLLEKLNSLTPICESGRDWPAGHVGPPHTQEESELTLWSCPWRSDYAESSEVPAGRMRAAAEATVC